MLDSILLKTGLYFQSLFSPRVVPVGSITSWLLGTLKKK